MARELLWPLYRSGADLFVATPQIPWALVEEPEPESKLMNFGKFGRFALVVATLVASVGFARAAPMKWTFGDYGVADSGYLPITGSFVFDAPTGMFSDVQVTTLAGTLLPGAGYNAVGGEAAPGRINLFVSGALTSYVLDIGLVAALPAMGGSLFDPPDVAFGAEWACSGSSYCAFGSAEQGSVRALSRNVDGAPILVGTPVPEPGSLALAGLALTLLVVARRRVD